MAIIDTDGWKEFNIGDLFQTEKIGKSLQVPTGAWINTLNLSEGTIPRITVSNFNNGIVGYYSDFEDSDYRIYENFISVSFLGTVFYQPGKASLDMKVHCLKPLNVALNYKIACFLVTMIKSSIDNFVYQDQLSATVLPNVKIKLPSKSDKSPDWDYMDSFMAEVMKESKACLENLMLALRI